MTSDIETRVLQSLESSLQNLGTDYIDCLVLHSLYPTLEETLSTWKAMERYVPSRISSLGISNTDLSTLSTLYDVATVKPVSVQNRFTEDMASQPNPNMPPDLPYPEDRYDKAVRDFCATHGMTYLPWGLLWGNPTLMDKMDIFKRMAEEIGVTRQVACFGTMRDLGGCNVSILCGTQTVSKMKETMEGMERIGEYLAASETNQKAWNTYVAVVKHTVDQ